MPKKKLYVFFTTGLNIIGGAEMYVAGKTKYLRKKGWEVQCFSYLYASSSETAIVPLFDEYVKSGNCEYTFLQQPPYKYQKTEQEIFLNVLIAKLGVSNPKNYEIIIESHIATADFWGELLALRLGARHFCVLIHEEYWKDYWDNKDFFYFKWKRNELITSKKALNLVFNGYKNVTETLYEMPYTTREMDAIQDVYFPMDKIEKRDWNICHIGRIEKNYVPYVIDGVAKLARRHPDKTISLIFVGKVSSRREFILKTFDPIPNIEIVALGDLVPIPRILFSKVDVVCAISQSARFAASEGILTIVGKADQPDRTPGVLGYDTKEQVHGPGTFSWVEALENVLVKKLYDDKEYQLPKLEPAENYYEKFWIIVKNAAPTLEYYTERLSEERFRFWAAIFPFATVARGARVIFVGYTEITKDYIQQIQSQENTQMEFGEDYIKYLTPNQYCKVVAIIDDQPENFDDSVVGFERLKQKDYDVIVISTYPKQANATYDKILKVVPEMAERVVYSFRVTQI